MSLRRSLEAAGLAAVVLAALGALLASWPAPLIVTASPVLLGLLR